MPVIKRIRNVLLGVWCSLLLAAVASSQSPTDAAIKTSEAKNHVGEQAEVCGTVVSTRLSRYGVAGRGRPTYLFFGKPYPDQVFIAVTWAPGTSNPPAPEFHYEGKLVCVTGKIVDAAGTPEIITHEASQIKMQSSEKKE